MSNNTNTNLIERALELAEECTGTVMGAQLEYAAKHSNLEYLYELVVRAENYLNEFRWLSEERWLEEYEKSSK